MKKKQNQGEKAVTSPREKKKRGWIIAGIFLAAVLLGFGIWYLCRDSSQQAQNDTKHTDPTASAQSSAEKEYQIPGFSAFAEVPSVQINDTLYVACMGAYTGNYFEDGSDEPVEDVLGLVVKNTGSTLVEYAEISVPWNEATAEFHISALPAGESVLVLEAGRTTGTEGSNAGTPVCSKCALGADVIYDYSNDFTLYPDTGVINVQNVSGEDITGSVSVYYKNYNYGVYLGGIAYRARFEDGIASGETAQSVQDHYDSATSRILYMTYDKDN